MVARAYILVETEVGRTRSAARTLALDQHVRSADVVTGPFDIIVVMEARDLIEIGELVFGHLHTIPGIARTTTCLAIPS